MITRIFLAFVVMYAVSDRAAAQVSPDFWVKVAASTASLRTGGGTIVASDVLPLGSGRLALITYWELARGSSDRDIYRCIDVQTIQFEQIEQTCWSVLTPSGRRPIESGATPGLGR